LRLLAWPLDAVEDRSVGGPVEALAVDAHARGHDEPLDRAVEERLEEDGGAARVRVRVLGDLVHALTDADAGREVGDRVDALDRASDRVGVADVADEELDLGV